MSVIDHLAVELTLESGKFAAELSSSLRLVDRSVNQFSVSFKRMGSELASVAKLTAGVGITMSGLVATGLSIAVVKSLEAADALNKMSERMGVSVEWLQKMEYAAQLSGASLDDVSTASRFLERNLSNAAAGGTEQIKMFERLGLSVDDLRRMKPEERFMAVAEAMGKVTEQGDKTVLMMQAFGRGGMTLAPLMKDGAKGINELGAELQKTGAILDKQSFNKLEMASDALEKLEIFAKNATKVIADELSPYIIKLAEYFTDNEGAIDAVRSATKVFVEDSLKGFAILIDTLRIFSIAWHAVKASVASLSVAIYEIKDSVAYLFAWWIDRANMTWEALKKGFDAFVKTGEFAWVSLKSAAKLTMDGVLSIVGLALVGLGKALGYLPGSIGKSVEDAGRKMVDGVRDDTQKIAKEMNVAADAVEQAWVDAGAASKKALTGPGNVGDIVDGYKSEANRAARILEKDYWEEFNAILNKPFEGKGIIEWGQKVTEEIGKRTKDAKKTVGGEGGGFGAPVEDDTEGDKRRKANRDALVEYTSSETDIEVRAYEDRMAQLRELKEYELISEEEFNAQAAAIREKHADNMVSIDNAAAGAQLKTWKSGWAGKMQIASQYLGNIATLMNSKSKAMFEVGKIAAYAQTVVNTAEAAMSSFKFGAAIGGPVVGAAFAATAVAAGLVQLQTIRATSFGGGGSPSSGGGGGSPSVSGPPMPGELNNRGIPSTQSSRSIVVNLQGKNFTDTQVRDLIDQINEQQYDGVKVNR